MAVSVNTKNQLITQQLKIGEYAGMSVQQSGRLLIAAETTLQTKLQSLLLLLLLLTYIDSVFVFIDSQID